MLWHSKEQIQIGLASQQWMTAEAVVTESGFYSQGLRRSAPPGIKIEYQFLVGGTLYLGTRVGFGPIPTSINFARPEVGEKIQIRYEPDNPAQSVYIAGVPKSTKMLAIIGGALAILGFAWLLSIYIRKKETQQ